MKKIILSAFLALAAMTATADEKVLFDFENYQIGEAIPMHDVYSQTTESTAKVEADPKDAGNKVLHVTNKSWNTHVELTLDGITAEEMTGDYRFLMFELYRPASDTDRYKQFSARIGNDTIYADNGFFDQGDNEVWLTRSYRMERVTGNGDKLYIGFNSISAEFYIDNIRIVNITSEYDPDDKEQTLRYHAAKCGRKVGVAVPAWNIDLSNDKLDITKTIYANFSMVVAENEMKIDALQPNEGQFNYDAADRLVTFARRHVMDVRGHTLVWHSQIPKWMSSDGYKNDMGYTRAQMLKIMENHITNVMTHFKGKVVEWDVVNECLDDDQSAIRSNPSGYTLRKSVWYNVIGEDFLDSAFVYARRADPDAKLYINDYGVEMKGRAKAEAYYNLVKSLKNRNVPIDGAGLQSHLTTGELDSTAFDNQVKRIGQLGLNCIVTELDISIYDLNAADAYDRQAEEYRKITNIMLQYDHCPNLLVWGIKDDMSWRSGEPLLFSNELEAKPSFFAMRNAYKSHYETSGIEMPETVKRLSPYVDVYDMGGRPVARHLQRERLGELKRGLYIVDGKVTVIK
ncbi:MAG: endo-1,4-beta-xylanase [Prevotella sp.]